MKARSKLLTAGTCLALVLLGGAAHAQSSGAQESAPKKIKDDSATSLLSKPETKEVKAKREKNRQEKLATRSQLEGMNAKYIQEVRKREKTRLEKEAAGKTPQLATGAKKEKK